MRGRKPVPDSDGSRALEHRQERTGVSTLDTAPPEELSPAAQIYWDAVVTELVRAGMFQQSDVYTIVEMVETYAMAKSYRTAWRDAANRTEPRWEDDKDYGILGDSAREARIGYKHFMDLFNKMAAEHGMTPAARLRLGLGQIKAATLLEALDQLPD